MTMQADPPVSDYTGANDPALKLASKRKSLFASGVGNVLEWYEWSAYAVFAPFIAAAMFDKSNEVSALLGTFAVFAVGFLMRPLGGIVFGRIADRRGRKFVLITTMLMMAGGSLVIGLVPTYDQVGVWASVILLAARMIQGFAHGGESATAYSYVGEIAPAHRRGMWGSVAFVAIFGGSVVAYSLGGIITESLGKEGVAAWGWRIPFLLGAVLALVALILRRTMEESEHFEGEVAEKPALPPVDKGQLAKAMLLMIGMTSGIAAAHYTWTSYISTYAIKSAGMDPSTAYWMSVAAQSIALFSLPVFGYISDHVGRRPNLLVFAALLALLQIPLTGLISHEGWTLLVASTAALLIVSIAACILGAVLSENFPTHLRAQGIGFAYSISVAVFGGTAPYLNQLLISKQMGWAFNVYIIVLACLTGLSALFLKETRGIHLHHVK